MNFDIKDKMFVDAIKEVIALSDKNKALEKENKKLKAIIDCLIEKYANSISPNLVFNWLEPDMPNTETWRNIQIGG